MRSAEACVLHLPRVEFDHAIARFRRATRRSLTAGTLLLAFAPTSLPATAAAWDVSAQEPAETVSLDLDEGTWISVDVSPDGALIAFDLLGDIYTLPAGGGDARLVRGGGALERQPRFSPDGKRLAFVSDADGADNLWVSAVDGSSARPVSAETRDRTSSPSWSPDGRHVAVTRVLTTAVGGFTSSIHLYHLEGGAGRTLVAPPGPRRGVTEASFASQGKALIYTEEVSNAVAAFRDANQPNYVVVRRDLDSGAVERLIGGYGSATTARMSPDGRRVAFIRRVRDRTVLFVRDLASGTETPVYDRLSRDSQVLIGMATGYGSYPGYGWFPDSRHVAIWSGGKLLRVDVESARVQPIPFRVRSQQRIVKALRGAPDLAPATFPVRSIGRTTTSPDERHIVFSALGSLWIREIAGGAPRRLTNGGDFEFDPQYSPDGRRVAYVSWNDERGGALNVVAAAGGRARVLHASSGVVRGPAFSRDAKRIAFFVDQPSDLMGGYRARAGVHWIPVDGGRATFVTAGTWPRFAPTGDRLRYSRNVINPWGLSQDLHDVRLDGLDDRKLVTSQADARDFLLSPDDRWLAYRQFGNLYVTPYLAIGTPLSVDATLTVPARSLRISRDSAWNAHWSPDGTRLHWTLGADYYTSEVESRSSTPPVAAGDRATRRTEVGLVARTDVPAGSIAFVGARIITMQGDRVIERGTLLVQGNRIVAVGEDVDVPATAKRIDVTGRTIMPGLVDMHGHLTLYQQGLSPQKHAGYYAALAFGITTNFDPSSGDVETARNAELIAAGRSVGPRLIGTGTIAPGYRGGGLYYPVDSLDDARAFVRRKVALGFPVVKSYMQPMRRQRQQLIAAAREAGLMAVPEGEGNFYGHLTMILDGHTTVEHNNPVPELHADVIGLLAASGTAYTPTLVVTTGETFGENYWYAQTKPWEHPKVRAYVQNTLSSYSPLGGGSAQPPYARGMVSISVDERLWEIGVVAAARSVKRAADAGVVVNAGSHGQIHGIGMHWELWHLASGGMTPMEVLRTATVNPARTLGVERQIGSLQPGMLADLIVLDRDPLADIRNTDSVRYTMVNGRLYDSYTMHEIGNVDRPRSRFYWELPQYNGVDWNSTFQGDDESRFAGYPGHDE